jgi:hypothetical protein
MVTKTISLGITIHPRGMFVTCKSKFELDDGKQFSPITKTT